MALNTKKFNGVVVGSDYVYKTSHKEQTQQTQGSEIVNIETETPAQAVNNQVSEQTSEMKDTFCGSA